MTDHERDAFKEALKYEVEVLKFLALLTVAIGGGTLGLVLGETSSLRIGLAGAGFLSMLLLFWGQWHLHKHVRSLIEQLKEDV